MKLDQDELACRMLEAGTGMKRPSSLTGIEALLHASEPVRKAHQRMAAAAILYFVECVGPLDALPAPWEPPESDRTKINGGGQNGGQGAA